MKILLEITLENLLKSSKFKQYQTYSSYCREIVLYLRYMFWPIMLVFFFCFFIFSFSAETGQNVLCWTNPMSKSNLEDTLQTFLFPKNVVISSVWQSLPPRTCIVSFCFFFSQIFIKRKHALYLEDWGIFIFQC